MTFLNILLVVVGFSSIIFLHELGHFMAARRAGIKCPVFSIGFPLPAFLTNLVRLPERFRNILVFTKGETEWRIGWIPFGGFVQMKGQSDTPTGLDENEDAKDDFRNVSYVNKVLVISGGVIMNAITGVVFFILAFAVFGVTFIEPEVGGFILHDGRTGEPTSAWVEGEIKPGDHVLSVNGIPVTDFEDVQYEAFFSTGSVDMKLRRPDGSEYETKVPLNHINPRFDVALPPLLPRTDLLIGDEEAERSNGQLKARDRILKVNGVAVTGFQDLTQRLTMIEGGTAVTLTVEDADNPGPTKEVQYTPRGRASTAHEHRLGMALEGVLRIDAVRKTGPAGVAGLKRGDVVTAVRRLDSATLRRAEADGWRKVRSASELKQVFAEAANQRLELQVERADASGKQTMQFALTPQQDSPGASPTVGVVFSIGDGATSAKPDEDAEPDRSPVLIADVLPGSPADKAGIQPGDKIAGVIGIDDFIKTGGIFGLMQKTQKLSITSQLDLALSKVDEAALEGKPAPPVKLSLIREGSTTPIEAAITPVFSGFGSQPLMVIETDILRTPPLTYGFGESITKGFEVTHKKVVRILETLKGLFSGQVAITNLAGPVLIAKASYDLTKYGFGTLLFFLGFISINLAIVNFLPIPVLDGGLFVVATIEKIKGSPLNERVMGYINFASFIMVIGLMLFVVFNDIRNLLPL